MVCRVYETVFRPSVRAICSQFASCKAYRETLSAAHDMAGVPCAVAAMQAVANITVATCRIRNSDGGFEWLSSWRCFCCCCCSRGTKVCRYNWHSAGSWGWPFPMLTYINMIFEVKYTEGILSNGTRKLLRFEITQILIAVLKMNLLCYLLL